MIILDASGMKVYGEGEWKRKIHGRGRPRKWVKLHIAIDEKTQEIVSQKTTEQGVTDGQVTEYLLKDVDGVKKVLADGAYDGKKSRGAIQRKGGKDLVPPPKNARYRKSLSERDKAIPSIHLTSD